MPLLISPAPGSVSATDLHKLVIDHLKISADPNNTPYERFMALENATRLARQYQDAGGKTSLPVEVTDSAYVRRQLLAYGQMTLATAAHAINGRLGDSSSQSLHLRSAQTVIGLMARAGLQSEEQSYGVFGGRSVFDQRLAQLEAPKGGEKVYAAAITKDQDALGNLYLEGLRKLGLSDTEMAARINGYKAALTSTAPTTDLAKDPDAAVKLYLEGLRNQSLSETEMAARMNFFQGVLTGQQTLTEHKDTSTTTSGMGNDYAAICAALRPATSCTATATLERTLKPRADLSLLPL